MSTNTALPGYQDVSDIMQRSDADMTASEAHGALCGIVCASGQSSQANWIHSAMGDCDTNNTAVQASIRLLAQLHQVTVEQIYDSMADFQLLLADEDAPLAARTETLAKWCQGFVLGLAEGGIKEETKLPADTAELMRDFIALSRVSHEEDDVTESDEASYMELVEYVRVGVLLICEELQPMKAPQSVH